MASDSIETLHWIVDFCVLSLVTLFMVCFTIALVCERYPIVRKPKP